MKVIETKFLGDLLSQYGRDMSGKIVVITGTTSGTGFIFAREHAKLGATVVLLNRDSTRSINSLINLQREVPQGKFVSITCDLQDFASVRKSIEEIKSRYQVIDILCNNAAVMALEDVATKDGYDIQMQTNCLSHFLLTKELLPLLAESPEARIINHTSSARIGGPLELKYFQQTGGNLGGDGTEKENRRLSGPRWERYHQTKLANCTFTYGLIQLLQEKGITNIKVLLAHPGLALTNLQKTCAASGGMDMNSKFMQMAQSAEDGTLGILRASLDKDAQSGDFFGPKEWSGFAEKLTPEELLRDVQNIGVTWEGCEAAVGGFTI